MLRVCFACNVGEINDSYGLKIKYHKCLIFLR